MTIEEFVNKYNGKLVDYDKKLMQNMYNICLKYQPNEIWLRYYFQFLNERKNRIIDKNAFIEKHHIIPKCLYSSYKQAEFESNKIKLTCREHWIAHLILYKCFPTCEGLSNVAAFLGITRNGNNFNSKIYESLVNDWKQYASENMRKENKRRKKENPDLSKEYRERALLYYHNHPEMKVKLSNITKQLWENEEYRNKQINAHRSLSNNKDYRERQSKIHKQYYIDNPDLRDKLSKEMKINWADNKYKIKQTKTHQEAWKDPEKRKRMMDGKNKAWENNNLRKKQSEIIKAAIKKPEVRLSHAKGYLSVIEKHLKDKPNDKSLIKKQEYWLLEIKILEEEIKNGIRTIC